MKLRGRFSYVIRRYSKALLPVSSLVYFLEVANGFWPRPRKDDRARIIQNGRLPRSNTRTCNKGEQTSIFYSYPLIWCEGPCDRVVFLDRKTTVSPLSCIILLLIGVYRAFSYDITAAILCTKNNETAAILVYQTNPVEVEVLSYVNTLHSASHVSENALYQGYNVDGFFLHHCFRPCVGFLQSGCHACIRNWCFEVL